MCQRTYWSRPSIDMPFALFEHVLDEIPSLQSVKLQGIGEPLLHPDLYQMIGHARQRGLYVWTYTHGMLLGQKRHIAKLLESDLNLLRISVDGGNAETYEAIRAGARWELLLENIAAVVEARNAAHSRLQIELWMVALRSNVAMAQELVRTGARLGVDAVRVQTVANTYDYNGDVMANLGPLLPADDFRLHLRAAAAEADRGGLTFEAASGKTHSRTNLCPWPTSRTFISAEGLVVPCGTIADPRVINFGSIARRPFTEIWHSPEYAEFRARHHDYDIPAACTRCYGLPLP
jgi:radical SAM protein with 4Fe4S-binding SPASM domain